jgi:hypothetical protein
MKVFHYQLVLLGAVQGFSSIDKLAGLLLSFA